MDSRYSLDEVHDIISVIDEMVRDFDVEQIEEDIFQIDEKYSFAYCVSKDFKMSKGVAENIRVKFGGNDDLLKKHCKVANVASIKVGNRSVYHLVTKKQILGGTDAANHAFMS
ncbi:hypothetical protein HHI36_004905 [Cryptolaemus montrouzieri]|uniref:Uncharacterized protein n=1 Tax=Cryptolaemus montrouzieri TaxID=559131 RepID=A0ABD2NSV2_9CUCU